MTRRWLALFCWAFTVWVILTWTWTTEQLVVGVVIAAVVALACAPLGPVATPWALLRPEAVVNVVRLAGWSLVSIVRANLSLSRRIWSPRRPLAPGMVIVPTALGSEAGLTALGLISSLIVDNQLVDLDLARHELQYHAVEVESDDPEVNRARITGPIEEYLIAILAKP